MKGLVVDTSAWIDFFAGRDEPLLEDALASGAIVLPPIVVAELVSGARREDQRRAIADLLLSFLVHETPLDHWIRVGELRRSLKDQGLTVSTPDAHVAQCALERDAALLSHDRIFVRIAEVTELKLAP